MFQFPAFASSLCIQDKIPFIDTWKPERPPDILSPSAALISQVSKVGFPIRKSTDQRVFAPPRRLSQRITSFIACACQGIHQLPLRHLIVLIANAHPSMFQRIEDPRKDTWTIKRPRRTPSSQAMAPAQKDQLLEIGSGVAVRQTHQVQRIERPLRRTASIIARPLAEGHGPPRARLRTRNPNKSSLHDVMQNRRKADAFHELVSLRTTFIAHLPADPFGHGRQAARQPILSTPSRRMVEPDGIEPTTSCLQSRRSPS